MISKKEREAIQAARAEQLAFEQNEERQARLTKAKEKKFQDEKDREEKMAQDEQQMEIRRDLLGKSCRLMKYLEKKLILHNTRKQIKQEWAQYMKCDGLPDPRMVAELATFLYTWKEQAKHDEDELDQKCAQVLPMLDMLEDLIQKSTQYTERQIKNFNEIRFQLREHMLNATRHAAYIVLRDLEEKMEWQSIRLCSYQRSFPGLKLNVWVSLRMPTCKPKPEKKEKEGKEGKEGKEEKEPVELQFPGISVTLTLPSLVDGTCLCVRASLTMMDMHSERSRTFQIPSTDVPHYHENLLEFNEREHAEVSKMKAEQDKKREEFYKDIREKVKEVETVIKSNISGKLEKEKEQLDRLLLMEPPFMPDPRDWAAQQNEKAMKEYLQSCDLKTRTGELNLRKFGICGGIFEIDLLVTPPQPKRMENGIYITTLQFPKTLRRVDYEVLYQTPVPVPGITRTPEEIEIELRRIESEYEKLALVFIELSQDVLWNEPPVVVQWQEKKKHWTSKYINDLKYNEEKQTVQFRTGALWPIGLGCMRYSNMPYQGWEVKPDPKGDGVLVIVTGICVTCTWMIDGSTVSLIKLANASTAALKQHFECKYSVSKMIKLMREAACDFFPDFDAHNHVDGSCPKEWSMERHLYHSIALLCRGYNVQWSRWNISQGYRKIVLQMREAVDKKRESKSNLSLVLVTPQSVVVLRGNEHMQEWSEEPVGGMQFFPDLLALNLSYGSIDARRVTSATNYKLTETVYKFLREIKLCSFS